MNKQAKIYSAVDFANYYNGNMSFIDMHALEKAALDDPFLADALEGYEAIQTAEADAEKLKKKLNTLKSDNNRSAVLVFFNNGWVRIAAILIIILGVGYFFYNTTSRYNNNTVRNVAAANDTLQIAQSETKIKTDTPQSEGLIQNKEFSTPDEKMNAYDDSERKVDNANSGAAAQNKATERQDAQADKEKFFLKNTNQQNNTQNYSNYYTQQGNVADRRGGPMQGVTVKEKNTNNTATTDNNGNFKLKTTDSNAYVSVASSGYKNKDVLLNSNKSQTITFDKAPENLEEVVVVGYGTKKKTEVTGATSKMASQALNGKVSGLNVQPKRTVPPSIKRDRAVSDSTTVVFKLDNLALFNEYVKNNIIPVFDENDNPVKGTVVLSFNTDKKGKPQNIEVVNSDCEMCNNQGISLLKNGPLWHPKLTNRQTVIISF